MNLFSSISLIWLAAMISPGPYLFWLISAALRGGTRAVVPTAAGGAAAVATHWLYVLPGFGLLFQSSPWFYRIVGLVGGAYLVYLGYRMLRAAQVSHVAAPSVDGPVARSDFAKGYLITLLDPVMILFLIALSVAHFQPEVALSLRVEMVVWLVLFTLLFYTVFGCALARPGLRRLFMRYIRAIERIIGVLFAYYGAKLIWESAQKILH